MTPEELEIVASGENTALSLRLGVYHPQSDTSQATEAIITNPDNGENISCREYDEQHADEDGYRIIWNVARTPEQHFAFVDVRQGTEARYMAKLLRKLAAFLEANPRVMNQPEGALGEIRDGRAIKLKADGRGWEGFI